jgi:hypothetical protein
VVDDLNAPSKSGKAHTSLWEQVRLLEERKLHSSKRRSFKTSEDSTASTGGEE